MTNKSNIEQKAVDAATLMKQTAEATATALNIQYIQKDISDIKLSLKEMSGMYVPKNEFIDLVKSSSGQEERIRDIEKKTQSYAGALAVLTFIIPIIIRFVWK